jgi:hypothetical protein
MDLVYAVVELQLKREELKLEVGTRHRCNDWGLGLRVWGSFPNPKL